jgi:hypothetical protein
MNFFIIDATSRQYQFVEPVVITSGSDSWTLSLEQPGLDVVQELIQQNRSFVVNSPNMNAVFNPANIVGAHYRE